MTTLEEPKSWTFMEISAGISAQVGKLSIRESLYSYPQMVRSYMEYTIDRSWLCCCFQAEEVHLAIFSRMWQPLQTPA